MRPVPSATPRRLSALVGRTAEMATLLELATRPGAVALIEGEAGVGKTRLVRELLRHPALAARRSLVASCPHLRAPLPYGPIVEVLRTLPLAGVTLSPVAGALRDLLPELVPWLPVKPAADDRKVLRHNVFRAVRELLAVAGPAVLAVEDLHWADEGTHDLVRFLAANPPPELTMVLTYRRSDYRPSSGPLAGSRQDMDHPSAYVRLAPLTVGQVRSMAASLLALPDVPADFAAELHHRTAGLPLVVEEVLRAVLDRGGAAELPVLDEVEVPELLRDTTAERLAHLGRTAAEVVRAGAVLDAPATEQELAAVADLPADRAADALVRALEAEMLVEVEPGRYALRHPLARQAVYVAIPGPLRRGLHARAARTLTEPVRLAHHCRQAEQLDDWVRHTLAAVGGAATVGDNSVAMQLLEDALADPALPRAARGPFAVRLSREALAGIVHPGTLERLRAVLTDGGLARTARGEVRLNLGRLLINQAGMLDAGQTEIEIAVRDLGGRPALAARGMAALALPLFGGKPVEVHLRWLTEAEATIADISDAEVVAAVLANRTSTLMQLGDPQVWSEIAALPRPQGSYKVRRELARAYFNLADSATWIGHYDSATGFLDVGRQLNTGAPGPFLSSLGDGTVLRLRAATGEWDGLPVDAERLIDLAGDMRFLAVDAWLALGWVTLWRGDRAGAVGHFTSALTAAPDNGPVVASVRTGLAAVHLAQGDVGAACVEIDRAATRLRRKGIWVWAAELAPVAIRALTRSNRLADAEDLLAEFEDGIAHRDAPLAVAALDNCRGTLARAAGKPDAAREHFAHAAQRYAALPHPLLAAQSDESAATSAAEAGARTAAGHHFAAAAQRYETLGADRDRARCHQAMRPYASPQRRGRKGYGTRLSPREREVAALAGAGHTNRQIADQLFLSPRTVEQHVANAMRKLSLHSRAALADHTE